MSQCTDNFVEKCKAFWDKGDTDESGCLTVQELQKVIRKVYDGTPVSDADIAKMFAGLDKDGDKMLSFEEFSDCMKRNPDSVTKNELKQVFSEMDTDGSGSLTKDELKKAFQTLKIPCSDEELDDCLCKADTDSSGKISYEEFLTTWAQK